MMQSREYIMIFCYILHLPFLYADEMGLIFLVFSCTQSCVRIVLYLHLSKQVYICVIPEVPYYLKRKH